MNRAINTGSDAEHILAGQSVIWIALVAAGLTLILYARSLRLPFYSDDLVQLAWLRGLSFGQLWGQISPYGYYRPLAFSIWLVWRDLCLPLTPLALRSFNLILHALASTLVGLLAAHLSVEHRLASGMFATALFVAFPFSYQVVPWVSAIFYPLVVTLIAGASALHLKRQSGFGRYSSLLLVGLAPFAHENGMLAGALVAAIELADWSRRREATGEKYPSLMPLIGIGLNAAFMAIWFMVRPGGVTTFDLAPGGLWQNLTILITGLSFPLMPLAKIAGLPPSSGVWLFSVAALLLLAWLSRRQWPMALGGVGWFLLSIGPVLVTMRPDWLLDAPRFLYPAAAGSALCWGVGLATGQLTPRQTPTVIRIGFRSLLALGVLAPIVYFVFRGIDWHLMGGEAIRDAVEVAEEHPDVALGLVNLPDRLGPHNGELYPLFRGGAILLPPQVPAQELSGMTRPRDQAWTVGAILPPVDYERTTYGEILSEGAANHLVESGAMIYVADYASQPIHLRYAGRRLVDITSGQGSQPIAYFGDFISLWQAESEVENGVLTLTLYWEIIHPETQGVPTVFVHIVDGTGTIVAQGDGDPIMGLYQMEFDAGWIILEDVRYIRVPEGSPLTIYVGVWDRASGQRLPTRGGVFIDNRVPVGTITP